MSALFAVESARSFAMDPARGRAKVGGAILGRPRERDRARRRRGVKFAGGEDRLRAGFVDGLACNVSEDVQREHAPESVYDRCCGVGRVVVEVDDRAR